MAAALGLAGLALFAVYVLSDRPAAAGLGKPIPVVRYDNPNSYAPFANGVYETDSEGKISKPILVLGENAVISDAKIYKGRVYVTDAYAKRVYCYALNGRKIWESRGEDRFVIPNDRFPIDISESGELWVANTGKRRLEQLDPETGRFIASWQPQPRFAFKGCCNPVEFAALGGGRFATMEKGTRQVRLFDPSGNARVLAPKIATHWLLYRMRGADGGILYYDGEKNVVLKGLLEDGWQR